MSNHLLLGIDLGTSNAKAAVYDICGQMVAEASVPYVTNYPRQGWAVQRPSDWTSAISQAISRVTDALKERTRDLAALSLSAHGPGLVFVDKMLRPLSDASPIWQDERCLEEGAWLLEKVGPGWVGMGNPRSGFPAKLLWSRRHEGSVTEQANMALDIKGYLIAWLTGRAVTEPSSGPGRAEGWWEPVYQAVGWDISKLPEVRQATSVVGPIRDELSESMELPPLLPVVTGLNDGAAATLAGGALEPGAGVISLSTNGVVRRVMASVLPHEERIEKALFCWPYVEGSWVAGGQTKAGAASLAWLAEILDGRTGEQDIEKLLEAAEASPPGSRGTIFIPYLQGRGTPADDPAATAAFLGLSFASEPSDFRRSVLEGVTFALKEVVDVFAGLDLRIQRLLITGGGARSPLWRQIVADVLEEDVIYFVADSTLGAAIVAAVGLGLFPDFDSAVEGMTRWRERTAPRAEAVRVYAGVFADYQHNRDQMLRGSTASAGGRLSPAESEQ